MPYDFALVYSEIRQSNDESYKQNNANSGTSHFAYLTTRYRWHCARVNCNYAIIAFLWHKSVYSMIPDHSMGDLVCETTFSTTLENDFPLTYGP